LKIGKHITTPILLALVTLVTLGKG